jgi:8-oxo-dGTP pyrophosphatase MutT (NUDIX family)
VTERRADAEPATPSAIEGTVPPEDVRDDVEQWPVRGSVRRYEGPVASLRSDEVAMPGGASAVRDVLEHPGAVGVIALDDDGRVLLLRQYRHPVGRMLWEPPAGLLDIPGENPLVAAQRELFEETHRQAADWRVLVDAFTTPGISDEAIRIYLARKLTLSDAERHPGEHEEADMPLAWVPLDTLVARVIAGELHNPLLVMGALALRAALEAGQLENLRPADAPWPERPY